MTCYQPVRYLQGQLSAHLFYPLAERLEKRDIRVKYAELKRHYNSTFAERTKANALHLVQMVEYAGQHVPYYRDLFQAQHFDPSKLYTDSRYLLDIPYLTKDIIREQGARLLSRPLHEVRHHVCKTGGSTGPSTIIYYDQEAADYSAAVVLLAREMVGKKKNHFELHFASKFPDVFPFKDRMREHFKCFAMNRYNIFSDRLDDTGLAKIWQDIKKHNVYMVHGHPSTMYALACYVERTGTQTKAMEIFESSGELLQPYMREKIEQVFSCRVIDRYGLAEFGVIAYQTQADDTRLLVLDSEGWIESAPSDESTTENAEIVFTGIRNHLMPLIRYCTGDKGRIIQTKDGIFLDQMLGRIHDMVFLNGTQYPTHYIQDVLDRIGGIQEFQINLQQTPPRLLIVPEAGADTALIKARLNEWWKNGISVEFGTSTDIIRVGRHAKFRHVITTPTP